MQYLLMTLATWCIITTAFTQDLKPVDYNDGSQKLQGFITSNAGKDLPSVLILPAWKGVDNEAKQAALNLQKAGYIAFIADIYGVGNTPADNAAAGKIASHYIQDYQAYQRRIQLALETLKKHTSAKDKIAVIGYCFGGTGALEVMRAGMDVKGVVCIHGGLKKEASRENKPIYTRVLVLNPAEDASVTDEVYLRLIRELKEGQTKDWQVITYANAKHTFTNPESPDYNKLMADRAWKHTMMFLNEILRK